VTPTNPVELGAKMPKLAMNRGGFIVLLTAATSNSDTPPEPGRAVLPARWPA
jgi:hypothetical protein